jgi:hypothetical protein
MRITCSPKFNSYISLSLSENLSSDLLKLIVILTTLYVKILSNYPFLEENMTRNLITTTALLTLFLANDVHAACEKPGPALTLPALKISGQTSFNSWFFRDKVYIKPGDNADTPQARQYYQRGQLFSVDNSRLRFNVDGKTDKGMEYGLVLVLDGAVDAGNTLRENYLYFGGTWGKIYAGDTYGVEKTMAFGGFDQWGGTGFIDGSWDRFVNYTSLTVHSVDLVGETSRDTKFTYLTPRWNGLQLGFSYTPTQHRGEQTINARTSQKRPQVPFSTDNVAGGLNFIHKFECGLDMALSATGIVGNGQRPYFDPNIFGSNDVRSYALGGTFGFKNFGFSAEFGDNGKSLLPKVPGVTTNAGKFVDLGLSYTYGATKLSGGYFHGWRKAFGLRNPNVLTTGFQQTKSKTNAWSAAVDHKLAPGLGVYIEYNNVHMKNPQAISEARVINNNYGAFTVAPVPNNKVNSLVVGSRLVF